MLNIVALRYISFSEINKVDKTITPEWASKNPEAFNTILYNLGMDISIPYDWQVNIQHRNYFNEVVTCDRIVGNERLDKEWLEGNKLASTEAKDKARKSKLVIDLYRLKGMVESE